MSTARRCSSCTATCMPIAARGRAASKPRNSSFSLDVKGTPIKPQKGTKTHNNLRPASAGESRANRRYLYFAAKADVEGQNDVSALFRSTAEGETGHAHGHLEYLEAVGDPATNLPIGRTRDNLKAAVAEIGRAHV